MSDFNFSDSLNETLVKKKKIVGFFLNEHDAWVFAWDVRREAECQCRMWGDCEQEQSVCDDTERDYCSGVAVGLITKVESSVMHQRSDGQRLIYTCC